MDLDDLVSRTDGFSGADIKLVCRDASMMPMRRAIANKTPADIVKMKAEGKLSSKDCPLISQVRTRERRGER